MTRTGRPRKTLDPSTQSGRLAAWLQRWRLSAGLTVAQAALLARVPTKRWYAWEEGAVDRLPVDLVLTALGKSNRTQAITEMLAAFDGTSP